MNNVYIFDNLLMNPHKLFFPSYWIQSFSVLLLSSHSKVQQGRRLTVFQLDIQEQKVVKGIINN